MLAKHGRTIVDGNQKSGINSPVEVGRYPIIYRVLAPSLVLNPYF